MNTKELIEFYRKSNRMGPLKASLDPEMNQKNEEMMEYFQSATEEAGNLCKEHMSEKDLVILLKMLEGVTAVAMVTMGEGSAIFMASQMGELQVYTQNVCLAFLGIVVNEEII